MQDAAVARLISNPTRRTFNNTPKRSNNWSVATPDRLLSPAMAAATSRSQHPGGGVSPSPANRTLQIAISKVVGGSESCWRWGGGDAVGVGEVGEALLLQMELDLTATAHDSGVRAGFE